MNLHIVKKKFVSLIGVYIYRSGASPRYLSGIVIFFLYFFAGSLATLILAPVSLNRPIRILVKRQMSERKASFFIEEIEGTLRELGVDKKSKKAIVIGPYFSNFPNDQLSKMYGKHVFLLLSRSKIAHNVVDFIWPVLGITRSKVKNSSEGFHQKWSSSDPIIKFDQREISAGLEFERKLFGNDIKPFVTLSLGCKSYRDKIDVFDQRYVERPLTIINLEPYKEVIQSLVCAGLNVVRFGTNVTEEIPVQMSSLLYDSTQNRSDFSDVWLNSRCKFVLCGASGGWWLGAPFNTPVVLTNSPHPIGTNGKNDIFIPCMPWLKEEDSFASFLWQIQNFEWSANPSKLGQDYFGVQNSPSQIVDSVDEMLKRLSGEWYDSVEDLELQARFKKLQGFLPSHLRTSARIGAKFLREHQHLLPD